MVKFELLDPRMTEEHLGFIPSFLDERNPEPAAKQLDANYGHGGGWRPFKGFAFNPVSHAIKYLGDPEMKPLAQLAFHVGNVKEMEMIYFYRSAWVAIVQANGDVEISRMD